MVGTLVFRLHRSVFQSNSEKVITAFTTITTTIPEGPSTQSSSTLAEIPLRVWFLEPETAYIGYLDPLGIEATEACLGRGRQRPHKNKDPTF